MILRFLIVLAAILVCLAIAGSVHASNFEGAAYTTDDPGVSLGGFRCTACTYDRVPPPEHRA